MHKKGQAEDFFNDLIPAIILIIIAIVIIVINSSGEERSSNAAFVSDMSSLRRLDLVTYLRMPATIYGSFAEYLAELHSGNSDAIKFTSGVEPYVCDAGLESELRNNLGKAYSQWSLRAFDSKSGAMFFSCYSDSDFFTDAFMLYSVDVQSALFGNTLSNDVEMVYLQEIGLKYFDIAMPSKDPSNNIVVRLGVKNE